MKWNFCYNNERYYLELKQQSYFNGVYGEWYTSYLSKWGYDSDGNLDSHCDWQQAERLDRYAGKIWLKHCNEVLKMKARLIKYY